MKSLCDSIFKAISAVSILVVILSLVVVSFCLYGVYGQWSRSQLEDELSLAMTGVQEQGTCYLSQLPDESFRLTWINEDGTILYDTAGSTASHKDRQEFIEAETTGSSFVERYSDTLMEKTVYLARKLPDGSVLRIGQGQAAVISWMLQALVPALLMVLGVLVGSLVFARSLSRKIMDPLNRLDLDDPLKEDIYLELLPVADRLETQYRLLRVREKSLNDQKAEFEAVISTMNEAIVIYEKDGTVLTCNKKAAELFDLSHLPEPGKFTYGTSIWQVEVDTVYDGCYVLLAYDITTSEQLAASRQAFTANVSHELKTPLQTILGSSELLASGMVKAEDVPQFGVMIHEQASLLFDQVMDILELSRLDEMEQVQKEPVSLDQTVYQTISHTRQVMDQRHIQMECDISPCTICANTRLVSEIVANIISNAIKFTDGWLKISVKDGAFAVANNGPEIPADDLPHIFERFWRADASRSRQDGSTGLGLSIVKHAAMLCDASICVKSDKRQTIFEVSFQLYEP